jgi:hypothetical protein
MSLKALRVVVRVGFKNTSFFVDTRADVHLGARCSVCVCVCVCCVKSSLETTSRAGGQEIPRSV